MYLICSILISSIILLIVAYKLYLEKEYELAKMLRDIAYINPMFFGFVVLCCACEVPLW